MHTTLTKCLIKRILGIGLCVLVACTAMGFARTADAVERPREDVLKQLVRWVPVEKDSVQKRKVFQVWSHEVVQMDLEDYRDFIQLVSRLDPAKL